MLLDEVGELPAQPQASLLRVLETKKICRVGSAKENDVDVRMIAATHRDLEAMIKDGTFRAKLLGIPRRTVADKIAGYDLRPE